MSSRLSYFLSSAKGWFDRSRLKCPNCGSTRCETIKRKYIVTALRRCSSCRLLHRIPLDPAGFNDRFYNNDYEQGFTTDLPSDVELKRLIETKFSGTEKDYLHKVAVMLALGLKPEALIIDFGASWGYGAWQLKKSGFQVEGFEIGRARAAFAQEKLFIPMKTMDDLTTQSPRYDAVFTSHVLEHIPTVSSTLKVLMDCVKPGGLVIAFTPNGSLGRASKLGSEFHTVWGQVHPVLPDEQYYRNAAGDHPLLLATSPYPLELMKSWDHQSPASGSLLGEELLAVIQNRAPGSVQIQATG